MIKTRDKESDFEILLSTMNRTSLTFLEDMFPDDSFLNYNILIINQVSEGEDLKSNFNNIRVINSFEKGLSKSRNLAIKNAKGHICLLADDDVKYVSGFKEIILNAFKKYDRADMVTFQLVNSKGKLFRNYPNITIHNERTIGTANTVVVAFKRNNIIEKNALFNVYFGLGATFRTGGEYVFLRSALRKGVKIFFEPRILLEHPDFSSGQAMNDNIFYARSAIFYKYDGILSYLKLVWHLFLMLKNKSLTTGQFFKRYKQGLKGISRYKELLKQGLETRES